MGTVVVILCPLSLQPLACFPTYVGVLIHLPPSPTVAPGDAVPPNGTVTYTWLVPERAGPGAADESSVLWMYHSHVNEAADPAAGLLGPILITAAGAAATPDDPTPRDVKRYSVCLSGSEGDSVVEIVACRGTARLCLFVVAAGCTTTSLYGFSDTQLHTQPL